MPERAGWRVVWLNGKLEGMCYSVNTYNLLRCPLLCVRCWPLLRGPVTGRRHEGLMRGWRTSVSAPLMSMTSVKERSHEKFDQRGKRRRYE